MVKLGNILGELNIERILCSRDPLAIEIKGVTHDSRNADLDFIFVAVEGLRSRGTEFIAEAVSKGARVVVAQHLPDPSVWPLPSNVAWIVVPDSRKALSRIAAAFHGHPTRKMKVVGITGTAGKTTVTYLVLSVFEAAGIQGGLMGTIEVIGGGLRIKSRLTTPEATDIHATAAAMLAKGTKMLVMEASSHSLKLGRVNDVDFDIGVFTNLGHDHLDFHLDMEDYAASKSILFSQLLNTGEGRGAVVNAMDPYTPRITGGYKGYTLRFSMAPDQPGADIAPLRFTAGIGGIQAILRTPCGPLEIRSPLLGRHNLMNLMAAAGVGLIAGLPIDKIEEGLARVQGVKGRMEKIEALDGRVVVIDYCHTPESLSAAIGSLSDIGSGRIVVVFGAGGDREKGKRPLMGRAVAEKATCAIVTSDNPRSEDPQAIIDMIVPGLEERGLRRAKREGSDHLEDGTFVVIPDRREAIRLAIAASRPGDLILVAGKGHEDYQVLGDRVIHFSDREVVLETLEAYGLKSPGFAESGEPAG